MAILVYSFSVMYVRVNYTAWRPQINR
ncbi:hypothetical protein [Escherichia phage IMM-001]|nr:hypothetical protein [Escherichia phage IMM-001]